MPSPPFGLAREGAEVVINGRTQARKVDDAIAKIKTAVPVAKLRGIAADLGTAGWLRHAGPPTSPRGHSHQ